MNTRLHLAARYEAAFGASPFVAMLATSCDPADVLPVIEDQERCQAQRRQETAEPSARTLAAEHPHASAAVGKSGPRRGPLIGRR